MTDKDIGTRGTSDAPVAATSLDRMSSVAQKLDEYFNGDVKGADRKVGFVLLAYEFGESPERRFDFVSNGSDRRDLVVLFKEMISRFEEVPEPAVPA